MITERFSDVMTDIGSFDIPLDPDTVNFYDALELVAEFGHIFVLPQHFKHPNEVALADLLVSARYGGVVLEPERSMEEHHIRGAGMAWHLGDTAGVGPAYPAAFNFAAAAPSVVLDDVTGLLAVSGIDEGTITDTSATAYTVTAAHKFEMPATAIRTYLQAANLHARINPNGTLDVCQKTLGNVFKVTPTVVAVRYGWGSDPSYVGVHANRMLTRKDASEMAFTAWLVNRTAGTLTDSEILTFPYRDIHGSTLNRTVVFDSLPAGIDAAGTTQFLLNEIADRGFVVEAEIDTEQWELSAGTFNVGDYIYIYSPQDGFVDFANEVHFRGSVIWPIKARVIEGTWPLTKGMGVYYLPSIGGPTSADVIDLTKYVDWEYRGGESYGRLVVQAAIPGTVGC